MLIWIYLFLFSNAQATTEFYPLSLHDALPILWLLVVLPRMRPEERGRIPGWQSSLFVLAACLALACYLLSGVAVLVASSGEDRKSTRLNSSHSQISYAVFCFTKKIIYSVLGHA